MPKIPDALVWIDCEMTGLDPQKDVILEISVVITDANLDLKIIGPSIIIHQPTEILNQMNEWCTQTHEKSGLINCVMKSNITLKDAEEAVMKFILEHTEKDKCHLAGNSVHMDKQFLCIGMPRLVNHLNYRIIDVSTIKELAKRWYPDVVKAAPIKKVLHRATEDILESINELAYYRNSIFKPIS